MPRYFSPSLRRRLAPLALLFGALLLGKVAYEDVPREQAVRFVLAPTQQRDTRSLRITYSEGGELLGGLERRFPETGAPAVFTHAPSLRAGRYDLAIDLTTRDGRIEHIVRVLELPAEGTPRILLGNPP